MVLKWKQSIELWLELYIYTIRRSIFIDLLSISIILISIHGPYWGYFVPKVEVQQK